jgi:hypothetical protein
MQTKISIPCEMNNIAVSEFVKRQTADSEFSHFSGTWDELRSRTQRNFDAGHTIPGYRDGVVLVNVEPGVPEHPGCFYTNIIELQEGDKLAGEYKARQPGEEPRKSTWVIGGKKMPAVSVQVVLYRHDVLAENNEQSCDAEWEIISINANPYEGEVPMSPGTMIANHFHFNGGTETGWDNDRFIAELKKSVMFWKNKSHAMPRN